MKKKTGKKIIVGVIYRHPNYNFQEFQKCLTTTLLNFENAKCEYIICGDININLLSSSSNKRVATYIETLLSNGCNSLINNPTRFSFNSKPSLLDHIYTNNILNGKECGICLYNISDHLPVFVMIKNCKSIISNDVAAYTRCMRNFNPELFLGDLNSKLHQIEENILIDNDIENNFQNFISFFLKLLNQHAPVKQLSRREKNSQRNLGLQKAYILPLKQKIDYLGPVTNMEILVKFHCTNLFVIS